MDALFFSFLLCFFCLLRTSYSNYLYSFQLRTIGMLLGLCPDPAKIMDYAGLAYKVASDFLH